MKNIIFGIILLFSVPSYAGNCVTAYFVVPESFVTHMSMKIDNGDVLISDGVLDPLKWYEIVEITGYMGGKYRVGDIFTNKALDVTGKGIVKEINVISEGNLDPTKHYEIIEITGYLGDYVIGDRVTGLSANITGKGVVKEVSSVYPLKITKFTGVVVGTLDSGKKIVQLILDRAWIREVKRFLRSETYEDEMSLLKLKLGSAYIGRTKESVLSRFPELSGSAGTGEDIIPRFRGNIWSCNR